MDNNVMAWQAVIFGPDDTAWEGGTFKLLLEFTEEYPNKPPSVRPLQNLIYADFELTLMFRKSNCSLFSLFLNNMSIGPIFE